MGELSALLSVCLDVCQYGLMYSYSILCIIIQYYCIYFVAQTLPGLATGILSVGSWVTVTYDHYCESFR